MKIAKGNRIMLRDYKSRRAGKAGDCKSRRAGITYIFQNKKLFTSINSVGENTERRRSYFLCFLFVKGRQTNYKIILLTSSILFPKYIIRFSLLISI